jgi:putative ABC transport system permease protein
MIVLMRIALALCPPAFRREYGAAIVSDFQLAFSDERTVHGAFGAFTYALGATWDLLTTALREYAAMIFRDVTYAFRALRKTPSFTAIVVATLALAIGANAAVFSILHAVVLAPLPYDDPAHLIALTSISKGTAVPLSLPDYADVTLHRPGMIASAAAFRKASQTMTGHGEPRSLDVIETTPRLFETLSVRPQIGRFANEGDAARGAARTIVLSDGLWHSAFAANPGVLGSNVALNGDSYRIIGVAPPSFRQPQIGKGFQRADLWTFLPENGAGTEYDRDFHSFEAVARTQPGVSDTSLAASLDTSMRELARRYPSIDSETSIGFTSLTDSLVGSARTLLFALFAAVGAVLLVACANVANLLLSRAAAREREFSVRIAVGASRGRIVAQLLVETFVLASAGGAIGIGLAYAVVAAFVAFHPANIPRADLATVDIASILYTLGIVAFCTLVAGLAPGFTSAQRDVALALRNAGRGGDANRGARARSALVACEIAMTLALVISAGLVVRSFIALTAQPLGFDAGRVEIVGDIDLPEKRYGVDAAREAFMTRVVATTQTIPGVAHAAWAAAPPFGTSHFGTSFKIAGRAVRPGFEPVTDFNPVGPDYFRILHGTLLAGRPFTNDDRMGTLPVVIVNDAFARRFFPGRSPIGARIAPSISLWANAKAPMRTIVGVTADIRTSYLNPPLPSVFLPARQFPLTVSSLVIEPAPGADPGAAVAANLATLDPLLAKPVVTPLSSLLARDVATQRLSVAALCSLAFVALALSIAGVFAVVSYGVSQRTHEFGVRMALGADARQILRMVVGGAMRLAFTGVVLGLLVAVAGTRFLKDQLFDTQPLDPMTFGGVTALIIVAALVAALLPARRATRVDPIVALRYE